MLVVPVALYGIYMAHDERAVGPGSAGESQKGLRRGLVRPRVRMVDPLLRRTSSTNTTVVLRVVQWWCVLLHVLVWCILLLSSYEGAYEY